MGQAHAETIPKAEAEGGSRISLTCNCCPLQPLTHKEGGFPEFFSSAQVAVILHLSRGRPSVKGFREMVPRGSLSP